MVRILRVVSLLLLLVVPLSVAGQTGFRGRLPRGWTKAGVTNTQRAAIYKVQGEYQPKIDKLEAEIVKLKEESLIKQAAILSKEQRSLLISKAYISKGFNTLVEKYLADQQKQPDEVKPKQDQ